MAKNKYITDWMPQDETLNAFYVGVDKFIDDSIPKKTTTSNDKIFADPLHGYIQLKSWEVSIIDTKFFQRLRKISQLGLANQVFPSLNYTRFEHSIGVLGTVNELLVKLVENSNLNDKQNISDLIKKYEFSLRIAALLYDTGHCLFSHSD